MTSPVTEAPQLVVVDAADEVWRVGFKPEPWAWSGWEWAGADGRFHGRWDDRQGNFRTIYAGSTLLACLLEVLAGFQPDPTLALELDDIVEDDEDAAMHPTGSAGEISYSWLDPRSAASATLTGRFCAVTAAESIAALRPQFVALAVHRPTARVAARPPDVDRRCRRSQSARNEASACSRTSWLMTPANGEF